MDTFIQYGIAAASQAVEDAGIDNDGDEKCPAHRRGDRVGHRRPADDRAERTTSSRARGPRRISPFFVPGSIINMISGHLSIRFGFQGPNLAIVTACTTGHACIGDGGPADRLR